MPKTNKKARTKSREVTRRVKKKISLLTTEGIEYVDWKNEKLLRKFMSERAKIRARRVTGNSAQQQKLVADAIKLAREMALVPYATKVTTQRQMKDRDGRPRSDGSMPAPASLPPGALPEEMAQPDRSDGTEPGEAPGRARVTGEEAPPSSAAAAEPAAIPEGGS